MIVARCKACLELQLTEVLELASHTEPPIATNAIDDPCYDFLIGVNPVEEGVVQPTLAGMFKYASTNKQLRGAAMSKFRCESMGQRPAHFLKQCISA